MTAAQEELDAAFTKLPTLGPIVWLYARTQERRFTFLADLDWAVIPPVTLDQCRLFMKGKMPFAFFTWARVSDEVHQRLEAGVNKLAPHEWNSGPHLWLIDVVTPFGSGDQLLADLHQIKFKDEAYLRYLWPDPVTKKLEVRTFEPAVSVNTEVGETKIDNRSSSQKH
ncbi:toxin-activating lysine-acyltransferase [Herbaspirillum sp. YR522]|uniref:toxin-activating lysine-acyltransferase n=1 Tax=Herbaspirillum sp. YR522 TaxID=1144342 RepID=UPI00068778D4|nr:toxin-activating lysine-acyltransferase [Herbaspirillum sp. YR522]